CGSLCMRSASSRPRWRSGCKAPATSRWCATSCARSTGWTGRSTPCSTSRGSMPARSRRTSSTFRCATCFAACTCTSPARPSAQGLGMGLAIVKRLARLLGHSLTVASQPGRGTMFRIGIAQGALSEIQDVTAAADTLPMPALQPRTVLVIDDEEPIREGLSLLLEEWGDQALTAGSVEPARRTVRQLELPPDLILSDLHLGDGADGIAKIDAVRPQCGCQLPAIL